MFWRTTMDDEKLKKQIGINIASYRKRNGLTQAGLAERLNYSDKAVSKWERGESVPDVLTLSQMAELFDYTYVIDLYEYAPVYDAEFKRNFFLRGHLNPQGYALTAKMFLSYIDYLIRNNPEDFATIAFWNKPFYND